MPDTLSLENAVILKNESLSGNLLQAIFLPERGMNLISYKINEIELLDQSTKPAFEETYAGLGALIGPHFHTRRQAILPPIADESLFPHIAHMNGKDPFTHGVARYAPWTTTSTATSIHGVLSGKDVWNGVALETLEGQNFKMNFKAELTTTSLNISLDVVSDTDSIVGLHYYWNLPNKTGKIISKIQPYYLRHEDPNSGIPQTKGRLSLPPEWKIDNQREWTFELDESTDFTFYPFPNPREGKITLDTGNYQLITTYTSLCQENAWQLYHPKGTSFVCMEPVSSQDPCHPNLSVSSIQISLTPVI